MATSETWNDPGSCPFCGKTLSSPGAGFVAHIEESTDCKGDFDTWRDRINDDVVGGWAG